MYNQSVYFKAITIKNSFDDVKKALVDAGIKVIEIPQRQDGSRTLTCADSGTENSTSKRRLVTNEL